MTMDAAGDGRRDSAGSLSRHGARTDDAPSAKAWTAGGRERMAAQAQAAGAVILYTLAGLAALLLLFGACCGFSHTKWALLDHGIYTNALWNAGHGNGFRYLVDHNYLTTHLSFSLALVGLLFHVWDSTLLLMAVQWLAFCGGGLCLFLSCRRHRLPHVVTAAVLFFHAFWPLTQSVLLSSFHGIAMIFLLLPWLYHTCSFSRRWAPLPLALLLGLREDAFVYALPILLYVAIRERWQAGYVLAGLSLAYGLAAIFLIYPAVSGMTLLQRRHSVLAPGLALSCFSRRELRKRLHRRLLLVVAPLPLLFRRGAWRFVLLTLVPVAVVFASGSLCQNRLNYHYPAPVMAAMTTGLVEALGRGPGPGRADRRRGPRPLAFAGALACLTLAAHRADGFFWFGRRFDARYTRPDPSGRLILRAARQIPKEGLLVMPNELGGVGANRRDFLTWKYYDPARHRIDLVFCTSRDFRGERGAIHRRLLEEEGFGVRYADGHYMILQRGWPTNRNHEAWQWLPP